MVYDLHVVIQDNFAVVLMVMFLQIFLVLNNGFEPRIRRLFIEANILIMALPQLLNSQLCSGYLLLLSVLPCGN